MNKILNYLTNKVICAAFVVLGAFAASAELVKTPILQSFEGESEPVSVGYTVTGLGDFKNEVAVVFTNHTKTATWTVPATLENVQFLVVGGGGGGGGTAYQQGGGGGGGGGVVTGIISSISITDKVDIKVGRGGKGGTSSQVSTAPSSASSGTGAAEASSDISYSTVTINGIVIRANAGGRDLGARTLDSTSTSGGYGGSNAGSRSAYVNISEGYKTGTKGSITGDTDSLITNIGMFGNAGGAGYANKDGGDNRKNRYAAGGGGGADPNEGKGGDYSKKVVNGGNYWYGGNGGKGLSSDITGVSVVYGSGGGGGTYDTSSTPASQGRGGDGAGYGYGDGQNPNGLPNQGGGGGGGNRGNGGNGGSGIVVFRYTTIGGTVDFSMIEEVAAQEYPYTGEKLTVLTENSAYTVSYEGGVLPSNVNEYSAVITLKEGFVWADEYAESSRTVIIKVVKANDEWISEPSISKTAWSKGDEVGELTAPTTKFNADLQVVISKKEDSTVTFSSLDNLEAGDYVVTWTALGTDNYNAAEGSKTVEFTVVASDAIPPYTLKVGDASVNDDRELSISYSLSCEATTSKMAEIFAVYTIEGSGETNEVSLATQVALNGGAFTGTIPDLKPGATYSVAVYSQVDEEKSELTEFKTITVPGVAKNLTATATFVTTPNKKFVVTGSVTPGIGETKVTLHYSLNSTEYKTSGPVVVGLDGAFTFEVGYENISDTFSWYVTVANTFNKEDTNDKWEGELTGEPTVSVTTTRSEIAQSHYVWTGKGDDNLWTNPENWDCENNLSSYGYPGTGVGNSYLSTVAFTNNASVELNNATMYVDGAIQMSNGISVEISNGTLGFQTDTLSLGAENSILTLKKVRLPYNSTNPSTKYNINPVVGSTVIIDGDNSLPSDAYAHLKYSPTTAGKLVIKNFDGRTFISSDTAVEDSEVELDNARWNLRTGEGGSNNGLADNGLPKRMIFKDGEDRRAILRSLWLYKNGNYSDDAYSQINLDGRTVDIKLTEKYDSGHIANIVASTLSKDASCVFNIDVTDYRDGQKVRILTLNSRDNKALNYTWTATANGVDVKEQRNARMEWDGNSLCYVQDTYNEALILREAHDDYDQWITKVEYPTLAKALEDVQPGETVELIHDVTTDKAFEIRTSFTLDLKGKTVKSTGNDGNGVFWVKADGALTLEDSSELKTGTVDGDGASEYKMAIWADGGKVVINGGNYVNENNGTDNQYDLIYVKNGGEVVINGGTFKCQTPRWTLNSHNTNIGRFVVTGGKFYQYNPTDFDTDEDVTTWCTEEYVATKGDDDYFTVVKKPTIQLTIDLGDGVSSVDYKIGETITRITEDTTIDIPESGTVVSFTAAANDNYFAPTVDDVTVTETTTVTIAGVAFSVVESADEAITDANRNAVYAWAKNKGKSQSEISAAKYIYADYLFNFTEFSTAEPMIEITKFTADPLVIKAKVTVNGVTKIEDLSVTGLNGMLKYKAAATLEALETATPKTSLEETDRFFKIVVE